jgi:hypothetical protein
MAGGRNGGATAIVREVERVHRTWLWQRSWLVYLASLFHSVYPEKVHIQKACPP